MIFWWKNWLELFNFNKIKKRSNKLVLLFPKVRILIWSIVTLIQNDEQHFASKQNF